MKVYEREKYTLKAYKNEQYRLDVYDPITRTEYSEYGEKWEKLYDKAKKEVEKGKECSIWEMIYEFRY